MKPLLSALVLLSLPVCFARGQTGTFSVVHTFTGLDGYGPSGGLTQDKSGTLYGTTAFGGQGCSPNGCGVVFKISPESDSFTVLYEFGQAGGEEPIGVIPGPGGKLYGVTTYSPVIFSISSEGSENNLYTFPFTTDYIPLTGLTGDPEGNLYGIVSTDGVDGMVYKYGSNGVYTVLHHVEVDSPDPFPGPVLTLSPAGNLFGAVPVDFASGYIFKFNLTTGEYTILHNFNGLDGPVPSSPIIQDRQGNLYGAVAPGGTFNSGAIFKLDTAGIYSVLYNFTGGTDGGGPNGALVRDENTGILYGTAAFGGSNDKGAIFRLDSDGNESVLYSFTGVLDGYEPESGLIARKLPSGSFEFFGTTLGGGDLSCVDGGITGCGTVFKFTLTR